MTPFVEVPIDPRWPGIVRATIAAQSDEYFQHYFEGRIPSPEEKAEHVEKSVHLLTPIRIFQNNLYRVEIVHTPPTTPTYTHLSITRLDGGTCNEWADLQRIKNEIVGPEYEAIQLFPAESRLVNTGHQYHLWVHADPSHRFPVGWKKRLVFAEPVKIVDGARAAGFTDNNATQRRLPAGKLN